MRFHKLISALLHPVLMPTIGLLVYFVFVPNSINRPQQYALLGIVFLITYFIPVLALFILRMLGLIKSFQVTTINERRIPVLLMVVLFYLLADSIARAPMLRDIGFLFYGTAATLLIIYFLFSFEIKTSLHLVSFGNALGFFLALSYKYGISLLPIIMVFILLAGLVASSRLHLNAHSQKEIYVGFFLGVVVQFTTIYLL